MGKEMMDDQHIPVGRITFGVWEGDIKEYPTMVLDKEVEVKTTILYCVKCNRRHGDKIADTAYVGWRCRKCKHNNKGKVEGGEFKEVEVGL